MAHLIVVCGLPGSGKTGVSLRLAAERDAARMCPDDWMDAAGISLWDQESRARLEAAQWVESQALLLAGRDVVIEWGTWAPEERDVLHDWCRAHGVAVSVVLLDPPIDEVRRRLTVRNAQPGQTVIPPELVDEWVAGPWQPPSAEELSRYDHIELPSAYWCRPWNVDDIPFLWEVLFQSIHVREGWEAPPRSIVDDHHLAHYLRDFGRHAGDDAEIVEGPDGSPVGAAFCRRMTADDPGYGFVAPDIPELGMAVLEPHRGQGVGRLVLSRLLERHPAMSLSVDLENPLARRLYESLGFVPVAEVGTALTMVRRASETPPAPADQPS
jgi:predicted kinase/GNAT superfamily N-acetyltransferase